MFSAFNLIAKTAGRRTTKTTTMAHAYRIKAFPQSRLCEVRRYRNVRAVPFGELRWNSRPSISAPCKSHVRDDTLPIESGGGRGGRQAVYPKRGTVIAKLVILAWKGRFGGAANFPANGVYQFTS